MELQRIRYCEHGTIPRGGPDEIELVGIFRFRNRFAREAVAPLKMTSFQILRWQR